MGFEERMFFLILFLVSIYCLLSTTKIVLRLRSTRRLNPVQNRETVQRSLMALRKLLSNVSQTIGATFYLFGFVLFLNLAMIGNLADNSKTPIGYIIFENFLFRCAFAANAFFVFLVLHLIQWFVSRRLNSCAERLMASSLPGH
jgi:RNase adaptor protein for sRNA GlmZ degradation